MSAPFPVGPSAMVCARVRAHGRCRGRSSHASCVSRSAGRASAWPDVADRTHVPSCGGGCTKQSPSRNRRFREPQASRPRPRFGLVREKVRAGGWGCGPHTHPALWKEGRAAAHRLLQAGTLGQLPETGIPRSGDLHGSSAELVDFMILDGRFRQAAGKVIRCGGTAFPVG
jgi:hypothetical protein